MNRKAAAWPRGRASNVLVGQLIRGDVEQLLTRSLKEASMNGDAVLNAGCDADTYDTSVNKTLMHSTFSYHLRRSHEVRRAL